MNAFDYWRGLQLASADRSGRLDAEAERARWRQMAATYNRNALHVNAPAFAEQIAALVQLGETVLEIGPGTGGFTVPVAGRAARVLAVDMSDAMLDVLRADLAVGRIENVETVLELGPGTGGFTIPVAGRAARMLAVDMSDAMLDVLRAELAAGGIEHVETMVGEWPDVSVPVHDVVLAVNSLYRILDIRTAIERMTAAARRRVIVGWSIGHNPPVLPSVVDPCGPRRYRPGVTYIHLLLALHELGISPELTIHRVPRAVWRASYADAADKLVSVDDPTPAERAEAAPLARAMFMPEGDGVVHRYEGQVAVIGWPGGCIGEGGHGARPPNGGSACRDGRR